MGRFLLGAIGGLNIVAAFAFIGCGVCANISDGKQWHVEINNKRVADEKILQAHLEKKVPAYKVVKIGGIVTGYLACVGLILSAVALFFGRWWGKLVAAPIFLLAFLHHVIMIIYQLVWVNPAINSFFNDIPPIFGDAGALIIATQKAVVLFPGYVSIAWWVAGCLYYLIATPVVLFAPTSSGSPEDEEKPSRKSRRRDEDEDEDEEEPRPRKRKSSRDDRIK